MEHTPESLNIRGGLSLRTRLRACRSLFLTPGSSPDSFPAARAAGADAIIVDLESTVAPADKGRARECALSYLRRTAEPDLTRVLRINSPRSVDGLQDLLALQGSDVRPDAIIIPKCESAEEICLVIEVLGGLKTTVGVIPMVELARAVFAAGRMADAHGRVCGLFLGGGDLAADLGAVGTWENLLYARSRVVAAAATTGIAAIDVPYFNADTAGLQREATASRTLGMTGKAALDAEQLPVINTVFTPSSDAVAQAHSVAAARAAAQSGPPVLNGHVVEPATLREADRVLAIAAKEAPDDPNRTGA